MYRIGDYCEDVIQLEDEPVPADATPLLEPGMRGGNIVSTFPSLEDVKRRAAANLQVLPAPYRDLHNPEPYPVHRSPGILALREHANRLYGDVESEVGKSTVKG